MDNLQQAMDDLIKDHNETLDYFARVLEDQRVRLDDMEKRFDEFNKRSSHKI